MLSVCSTTRATGSGEVWHDDESSGIGKSLFVWDCVVADVVAVEPVSHKSNSLLTGKITGNFDNFGPVGEIPGKICEANQGVANKFPNQRNREFL
jgi:hypothetical protein